MARQVAFLNCKDALGVSQYSSRHSQFCSDLCCHTAFGHNVRSIWKFWKFQFQFGQKLEVSEVMNDLCEVSEEDNLY